MLIFAPFSRLDLLNFLLLLVIRLILAFEEVLVHLFKLGHDIFRDIHVFVILNVDLFLFLDENVDQVLASQSDLKRERRVK